MTDPFPELTNFLSDVLLYLIYIGVILCVISVVIAGILYLPIFGSSDRGTSNGLNALKAAGIGFLIIVLALPARNALLNYFPLPTRIPPIPYTTPTVESSPIHTPTPKPTQVQR